MAEPYHSPRESSGALVEPLSRDVQDRVVARRVRQIVM
jgi:hypothetical protein